MARRDDDIIKKLNRSREQQKEIQPLSPGDFAPKRSAFDLLVEQSEERRIAKDRTTSSKRPAPRTAKRSRDDSRYQAKKQQVPTNEPEIFAPETVKRTKPVTKKAETPKRSVGTTKKKTMEVFAPETAKRAKPVARRVELPTRNAANTPRKTMEINAPVKKSAPKPAAKPQPKEPEVLAQRATKPQTRMDRRQAPAPPIRSEKKQQIEMMPALQETRRHSAPAMVGKQPGMGAVASDKDDKLQYRHEIKYYINYRDYTVLRGALRALMSLDENAGANDMYHIRSLYFDDMYETALQQKIAGRDNRCKYRIRIYDFSDNVIKFEKKIKHGQYIAKQSISLTRGEYERIVAGDYAFLLERNEPLAGDIFMQMKTAMLRPRVLVDYHREAYVHPVENVRITFDKDLKGGLAVTDIFNDQAPSMPVYEMGLMVLEVKFNRYLPESIKCALNSLSAARRSAISKYVLCRKFD